VICKQNSATEPKKKKNTATSSSKKRQGQIFEGKKMFSRFINCLFSVFKGVCPSLFSICLDMAKSIYLSILLGMLITCINKKNKLKWVFFFQIFGSFSLSLSLSHTHTLTHTHTQGQQQEPN
jgi:hypothetical protein